MTQLSNARIQTTLALVENFMRNMQTSLEHIDGELRYTTDSVWPTNTIGDGGSKGSGISRPVERLVIDSRQRLRDHEQQLWDDFNAIASIAHNGSSTARDAAGERVPHPNIQRCNHGTGKSLEGFTVWQDEQCEKFPGENPVIEGMCDDCLARCNTWRETNGYERISRESDSRNYLAVRNVKTGPNGRFQRAC